VSDEAIHASFAAAGLLRGVYHRAARAPTRCARNDELDVVARDEDPSKTRIDRRITPARLSEKFCSSTRRSLKNENRVKIFSLPIFATQSPQNVFLSTSDDSRTH
jgi:hypothetical protein